MLTIYGKSEDDTIILEGCINKTINLDEGEVSFITSCGSEIFYSRNTKDGWVSGIDRLGKNDITQSTKEVNGEIIPIITINGNVEWIMVNDEQDESIRFFKGDPYTQTDAELVFIDFLEESNINVDEDEFAHIAFMARMIFTQAD